jgi:hypothetical protein
MSCLDSFECSRPDIHFPNKVLLLLISFVDDLLRLETFQKLENRVVGVAAFTCGHKYIKTFALKELFLNCSQVQ